MNEKKIRIPEGVLFLIVAFLMGPIWNMLTYSYTSNVFLYVILPILLEGFFCAVLFRKKLDLVFAAAPALLALQELYLCLRFAFFIGFTNAFRYPARFVELLNVAAFACLAFFALTTCEKENIARIFGKYRKLLDKLYFLPGTIWFVAVALNFVLNIWAFDVLSFAASLLTGMGLLFVGSWLKDPYKKEAPTPKYQQPAAPDYGLYNAPTSTHQQDVHRQLVILRDRFDRGEISKEEYDAMKKNLLGE